MKFSLDLSNTTEAYLRELQVEVYASSGVTVENLGLYNDDNQLVSFSHSISNGGTTDLIMGENVGEATAEGFSIATGSLIALPQGSGNLYEAIDGQMEVFSLRADISTVGSDNILSTTLRINGSEPNTSNDGIVWRDEGTDDGEDGADMKWIDLGQTNSENRIEQILRN